MGEIKVGDTVRRVAGVHCGMVVGDTAKVREVDLKVDSIYLEEFRGSHSSENLEVAPQTKTVADAYEEHKGKWPFSHGIVFMGYSTKHDHFFAFGEGYVFCNGEYKVCSREQFEAYAKEQEVKQEGEKWTHKLGHGNCRIKLEEPDEFGYVLIELEGQGYKLYKPSQLKPIKPKLTESVMLSRIAELARGTLSDEECGDKIRELFDTVDII